MPSDQNFRLAVLYPEHLNIYADRGNILFLRRRCEWRGIGFEVVPVGFGDDLVAGSFDAVYIGGGQDRDQALCAGDLNGAKAEEMARWFANGNPLLAVCGGYQLLGHSYSSASGEIAGIGGSDFETRAGADRLIGPIAIQTKIDGPTGGVLAGFENHAGLTALAPGTDPLGTVIKGHGNDGASGYEGVRNGFAIGTYLHGPLLPKNWWLADWLLAASLGLAVEELEALDDTFERLAHESALKAVGI